MSSFSTLYVSRENALLAWALKDAPTNQDLEDFLNRKFEKALFNFRVCEYSSSVQDNQELRDRCGL